MTASSVPSVPAHKQRAWTKKLATIRTPYRSRHPVKLTRVSPDQVRVCDLTGQGSQYVTYAALPRALRQALAVARVITANALLNAEGRWSKLRLETAA